MDIVDVLRSVGGWPDEVARQHFSCGEIADEIDRLRAEVASLKEDVQRAIKQRDMWDKANSEARQQLAAANGRVEMLREALTGLRDYALKSVCYHDETHRAGAIWEICDLCGKKWADDEGGKPEFKEPI
jgi:polyhydroxyalkanoate synthesis regulator phasin